MLISPMTPTSSSGPSASTSQQPRPIALPIPVAGTISEKSSQSKRTAHHRPPSSPPIVLAIHGGAGGTITPDIPHELQAAYRARLRAALHAGYAILSQQQAGGGSAGNALDAVCAAVKVLEDSPLFNAGKGAVFTRDGTVECEASVMVSSPKSTRGSHGSTGTSAGLPALMHSNGWFERGCPADERLRHPTTTSDEKYAPTGNSFSTSHIPATRRCAAATLIKHTKNPILLARTLFLSPEEAPHVLLAGEEAEKIGWEKGCVKVDSKYYWTLKRWREHRRGLGLPDDVDEEEGDDDASPPMRPNDAGGFAAHGKLPRKDEKEMFSLPSLPPTAHLTSPPPSYSSAIREGAREQSAPLGLAAITIEAPESSRRAASTASGSTRTTPPSSYYGRTPSLSVGSSSASASGPSSDSASTDNDNNEAYTEPPHPDSQIFNDPSAHFDFNSLPQGTVGACAIDAEGRIAVATSTGGKTNKNKGRIGDTPSVGAGFWAERFEVPNGGKSAAVAGQSQSEGEEAGMSSWRDLFCGCFSNRTKHASDSTMQATASGLALSGTGDGDYFLRGAFSFCSAHLQTDY